MDDDLTIPDIKNPKLATWNTQKAYDYANNIVDYENLEDVGKAITQARIGLFKINEKVNTYERKETVAKTQYDREYRRAYLNSTAKTEMQKKSRAELMCENLENEVIEYKQIKIELLRYSSLLRLELESLQTISNNLRQQMKMI